MKKLLLKIMCGALSAVFTLSVINMGEQRNAQSDKVNLQSPSLVYASSSNRYSNVEVEPDDEEDEEGRLAEEADSEKETVNLNGHDSDLGDYTINVLANYEEIAARVRGEDTEGADGDDDSYDGKFCWTKDSVTKVYASENSSSKTISQLKKGSKVFRISTSGNWSYVRLSNNLKGYIATKHLSNKKVNLPTPTPKPVRRVSSNSKSSKSSSSSKKKSTGGGFGSFVRRFVGCKYVAGGASPSGFDCSGFTMYCYRAYYGIRLPHGSNMQTHCGRKVSLGSMRVGDLIFLDHDHNGKSDHVGIYVGGGQMVHASGVKWGVCCVSVKNVKDIMMVRRVR